ncbi:MAG TPA: hypothetical protein VND41_00920, partial [Nitrososphaerales archaeon]|nr:hypothetical protein [Nitrososphaerales archaeon]
MSNAESARPEVKVRKARAADLEQFAKIVQSVADEGRYIFTTMTLYYLLLCHSPFLKRLAFNHSGMSPLSLFAPTRRALTQSPRIAS